MRKPISQWQIRYAFSDNKDSHDDFPNEARSGRTTATGGDTVIGTESTVGVMVRRLRALSLVLFGETSNAERRPPPRALQPVSQPGNQRRRRVYLDRRTGTVVRVLASRFADIQFSISRPTAEVVTKQLDMLRQNNIVLN